MDPVTSFIQSPLFTKLSGPLLIIISIILFWWRAGSIHAILERLWRLAAGKTEIQDSVLKEFIQENRDLEKFRFMYGLKIETKTDLHRLLTWIKRHGLDIARVQSARRWVSANSEDIITSPQNSYFVRKGVLVIACGLISIATSQILFSKFALLQMRESTVWFLADAKVARDVFGRWTINLDLCSNVEAQIPKATGFSETETGSLCRAFNDESLKRLIDGTVQEQRVIASIIVFIASFFIIYGILQIRSAEEARIIKRRVASSTGISGNELETIVPSSVVSEIEIRKSRRKQKASGTNDASEST